MVEAELSSETVSFLVTDVEDSTRLWQAEPHTMQASMARHDAILRMGIETFGGRVFKTAGDAFYATFDSPVRACQAALAVQRALLAEVWPPETPIRDRMALHTGVAQPRDGDWFGPAVNVVCRILSVAHGGQTLLSDAMSAAFPDMRANGADIESHGFYQLKGIDGPVEVFEQGIRGPHAFAPPHDTVNAYRVVRDGELWEPARAIRHNLPAERDTFVGRAAELRELSLRLNTGERLVTILGPAGTGKTRLVCRYAREWLGEWPGGVYFCDLSTARSLDGVLFTVATALEVPLSSDDPAGQLGHAIAARGRCLVILDNFEQLTELAPTTVGSWMERAADAHFAVTSRERLHIGGEQVFSVEPLRLAGDAVDLFAVRARAQQTNFAVNDDNLGAVAEVVRLLDGLPLAIELAAARIRVFSPAQLVERMRDRFRLLAGARGAAARHATLKAALDWSWDLLTPWERAAFSQCSVFEGGFTMEAAEAVLDLAPWPDAPPVMDAVQALVDKSLLRVWTPIEQRRFDVDEPYFGMYLSIHEYAAEKLDTVGTHSAQRRHGAYFARFGSTEALDALSHHGGVSRRRALALELDNLIAACRRAAARRDPAIAVPTYGAAWHVLELRGPFTVGAALGSEVLALEGLDASLRVAAIWTLARVFWRMGRLQESEKWLAKALTLVREAGDRRWEGVLLGFLGVATSSVGRVDEGLAHYEAALAIHREVGNRHAEARTLHDVSALRCEQGRLAESLAIGEQALAIYRDEGHRLAEAQLLGNLAVVLMYQGKSESARQYFDAAIVIEREIGDRWGEGNTLGNLATLEMNLERLDDARAHCEAAIAIARDTGDRWTVGVHLCNLADLCVRQHGYDEAVRLWNEALTINREVGNRRVEGVALGGLAEAYSKQGRSERAAPLISQAESLLREVGDTISLTGLMCIRGHNELAGGHREQARAALADAEAMLAEVGAGADSEVGKAVARLREALAASDAP